MLKIKFALMMTGLFLASPAFAMGEIPPGTGPGGVHRVPEIDASAGLLTVAGVAAFLVYLWEAKRRQRSK